MNKMISALGAALIMSLSFSAFAEDNPFLKGLHQVLQNQLGQVKFECNPQTEMEAQLSDGLGEQLQKLSGDDVGRAVLGALGQTLGKAMADQAPTAAGITTENYCVRQALQILVATKHAVGPVEWLNLSTAGNGAAQVKNINANGKNICKIIRYAFVAEGQYSGQGGAELCSNDNGRNWSITQFQHDGPLR